VERHQPVLVVQRLGVVARQRRFLHLGAERGATFAVTEMQPTPPCALKPTAVASSPESWTKSVPQAIALLRHAGEVAGRVLHADDIRAASQARPSSRAVMSIDRRGGML
jgi:hypothetical protein